METEQSTLEDPNYKDPEWMEILIKMINDNNSLVAESQETESKFTPEVYQK